MTDGELAIGFPPCQMQFLLFSILQNCARYQLLGRPYRTGFDVQITTEIEGLGAPLPALAKTIKLIIIPKKVSSVGEIKLCFNAIE